MSQAAEKLTQRFSPKQRAVLMALAAAELGLKLAAARDIGRRSDDQLRGSKLFWRLALVVNTIGPVGYFVWGRRET